MIAATITTTAATSTSHHYSQICIIVINTTIIVKTNEPVVLGTIPTNMAITAASPPVVIHFMNLQLGLHQSPVL